MGQLVFQATAGGQTALVGPNPSTNFSLNVPAVNGNLVTTGDTGTVTSTMLASSVYTTPGTIGSGTPNTGAFTSLSATSFTNTGTDTATKFIPTGSSVVGNGLYLPATNALGLSTNGTNALYIDSSQNVGIGTASPSSYYKPNLVVNSSSSTGINIIDTSTTLAMIAFGSGSNGTLGGNSNRGKFWYDLAGDSFNWNVAGAGNLSPNMRIDSSGNLLVGTTNSDVIGSGANGLSYRASIGNLSVLAASASALAVGRATTTGAMVYFYYNAVAKGSISTDGSNVAYNTSSDYRLKENIVDLPNALTVISQLKPRQFDWKETKETTTGFIAHELSEVMPQAVTGEKDALDAEGNPEYQGIDTSFLVATLTAAIQELNAKVDAQAAEIATLKAK